MSWIELVVKVRVLSVAFIKGLAWVTMISIYWRLLSLLSFGFSAECPEGTDSETSNTGD
jgi:hypothetical protein